MKVSKILFCQTVVLVMAIVLLSGCASDELTACQQENLKLKEAAEMQQSQTTELQSNYDTILAFLKVTVAEAQKCKKELEQLKKEKEATKNRKKLAPKDPKAFKKGLEELKALRETAAKRLIKEQAEAKDKQNK